MRVLRRDLFGYGLLIPAVVTLLFSPLLWMAYSDWRTYGVGMLGAWLVWAIGPWAMCVLGSWWFGFSMIRERRRLLREEFREL